MFNFAGLPAEVILKMASRGKLSPKDMIRLIRTSHLFNELIRDDSLWRPYLPEHLRYKSNLFFLYSAFMQSDKVTPLVKFLVHKKGMTYGQALCVRIHDERVIQKFIREEMTLEEARQVMSLSEKWRLQVLEKQISLKDALREYENEVTEILQGKVTVAELFVRLGFDTFSGFLFALPRDRYGIKMLLEGFFDNRTYQQTGDENIAQVIVDNPCILTALREGLISGEQIMQLIGDPMDRARHFKYIFTEESLQAMRIGALTPQDAIKCVSGMGDIVWFRLNALIRRIEGIAANYFERANPVLTQWLKEHPDFAVHARTLFNHANGWELYSKKVLTLDHLLTMPNIVFIQTLVENDSIVEALLAKKISIEQLIVPITAEHISALTNINGNYWLEKIINRTITATQFASLFTILNCDVQALDNFRRLYIGYIAHCGKSMTDLLRDANCELEHLVSLTRDSFNAELENIVPASDFNRINNGPAEEITPEFLSRVYGYFVQTIRNLTWDMKLRYPIP